MDVFMNKLIKEQEYNGIRVPKNNKSDYALILSNGRKDDIVINSNTSTWDIRLGKYRRLAEVSLKPHMTEFRFTAPSKQLGYSFDVYVMLTFRVIAPLVFYQNKDRHIESYLKNQVLLEIKSTTSEYGIKEYDRVNVDAKKKYDSKKDTIDNMLGVSYRISAIDITLGAVAMEHVQQYSKQELDAELQKNADDIAGSYSRDYEKAIMSEVVKGNCTLVDALAMIETYKKEQMYEQVNFLKNMRDEGVFTEQQMKNYVAQEIVNAKKIAQVESSKQDNERIASIDDYYDEE